MMNMNLRKCLLCLGDVFFLYAALVLMLEIRYWGAVDTPLLSSHILPFTFIFLGWITILYILDFYDFTTSLFDATFFSRFTIALMSFFVSGVIFFYFVSFSSITPKTNLLILIVLFGILSYVWRFLFLKVVLAFAPLRIGLLHDQTHTEELCALIHKHRSYGFVPHVCSLGGTDFLEIISKNKLHTIVLSEVMLSDPLSVQSLYQSLPLGVRFFDSAQAYELFAKRIPLSSIDYTWFIRNIHDREQGMYLLSKRLFDIVVSFAMFICTLPIWILIMIAIKLEDVRGTVFYTQKRVGKSGVLFSILKFRTMKSDSETKGAQWAQKNDPRVTHVGKFLRRSHLDELPQLINILKGDLSLVGPRPERPEFVKQLLEEISYYQVRQFIQPGFTGWAQIRYRYARSVTDSEMKFEYDLYYIKNRSFALDFLILLKTIQLFFQKEQ